MYYGVEGKQENESSNTFAKESKGAYFVKFCTGGTDIGSMLNPWGMYYNRGDENKENRTKGGKLYEYRRVTKEVFELYISFLQTKSQSTYRQAMRSNG